MATIVIKRTSEYMNMARDYGIYIDNVKVAKIGNGKIADIELEPGTHTLYAKIDWCYSPVQTFTITGSETKTFKVGSFKNAKAVMIFALIIVVLNLVLNLMLHFSYLGYLLFPVFLVMFYFISIGRKRYLSLSGEDAALLSS